jgi:hypothetical protein
MKFDDLDEKMRIFETAHDQSVLPGMYMVARIDGRGFTRLTKEVHSFEAPFDIRVRDLMCGTVEHLMSCGFRVLYGYTQSDEISLLFDRDETAFGRKERKYNSILAGEASAKFSLLLGAHAAFDCRISQLPTPELVRRPVLGRVRKGRYQSQDGRAGRRRSPPSARLVFRSVSMRARNSGRSAGRQSLKSRRTSSITSGGISQFRSVS